MAEPSKEIIVHPPVCQALLDFGSECCRNFLFVYLRKNLPVMGFDLLQMSIIRPPGWNIMMKLKLEQTLKSILIIATRSKVPVPPYCTTQWWRQSALKKTKQTKKTPTQQNKLFLLYAGKCHFYKLPLPHGSVSIDLNSSNQHGFLSSFSIRGVLNQDTVKNFLLAQRVQDHLIRDLINKLKQQTDYRLAGICKR